jgi:hypothetical protein
MLKALENMVDEWGEKEQDMVEAKAAIAKAKGEVGDD